MEKDCEWIPEKFEGAWDTGCKRVFSFTDAGPAENGFEFCPYCGGHLVIQNEADS